MGIVQRTAVATAPARVDLSGGTLDIWPLYLLVDNPVTVNAAIRLRARARVSPAAGKSMRAEAEDLRRRITLEPGSSHGGAVRSDPTVGLPLHEAILREVAPEGGLTLATASGVPAGSGLGGSSALAVAMLAAIRAARGEEIDHGWLIRIARDVEVKVIEVPTGTQDHLAALQGGVGAVQYGPGLRRRSPLPVQIDEFEASGTLAFLGAARVSARSNWDMLRRAIDGDPATRRGLSAIAAISSEMRIALGRAKLDDCARLLGEEWKERRGLSPQVSTPETEAALDAALKAGATGGKICGAGGGGCVFVMGPPDARERIRSALAATGCTILDFQVDREGLRIETAA